MAVPRGRDAEWLLQALLEQGDAKLLSPNPDHPLVCKGPRGEDLMPFTSSWLTNEAVMAVMFGSFDGNPDVADRISSRAILQVPDFSSLCHHPALGFLVAAHVGEDGTRTPADYFGEWFN